MDEYVASYNEFMAAFSKESDRGCAVLTLCVLEQALLDAVTKRVPVEAASLINNLASPGKLRSTIDNSYLLGVLSASETAEFQMLAKIRNIFGYNALLSLSFSEVRVKSLVGNLKFPKIVSSEHPLDGRNKFLISASIMYFSIVSRSGGNARLNVAKHSVFRAVDD